MVWDGGTQASSCGRALALWPLGPGRWHQAGKLQSAHGWPQSLASSKCKHTATISLLLALKQKPALRFPPRNLLVGKSWHLIQIVKNIVPTSVFTGVPLVMLAPDGKKETRLQIDSSTCYIARLREMGRGLESKGQAEHWCRSGPEVTQR